MSEESAWARVDELVDLLRDVCMDWVPECETEGCNCSAARARAFLAEEAS